MILKLYYAAVFIAAITFFSCAGKDNNDYIDKSVIPTAAERKAAEEATPKPVNTLPVNIQPGNTTINPAVNPVGNNIQPDMVKVSQPAVNTSPGTVITQQAQQTTAPGKNPPHGQPNHRCDIAVGAPLNSPPGKTNTTPTTVTTQQAPATINAQQAQQTVTAPGMNPAHGQPNHRCDIAVGAPLNSPPGNTKPAPTTINTEQVQQTVTAPGMNPAHGQPNHRCDIAVGAPLNSPPGPTATPAQTIAIPAKKDSAKN